MLNNYNIYIQNLIKRLLIILAVIVAMILLYFIAGYIAPFLIALAIAVIIDPVVRLLVKKLKFPRKLASLLVSLLFFAVLGVAIVLLATELIEQLISLGKSLPQFFNMFIESLTVWINESAAGSEWLTDEVVEKLLEFVSGLSASILNLMDPLVKGAINTAISIPEALLFIVATIMSTYFLSSDKDKILNFFKKQIPDSWSSQLRKIKRDLFLALFGYLRGMLIIMSITFAELFLGFSIIRVSYALSLAFLTSLIDALPIFGTGTVLLPWAAYNFLVGNNGMGIALVVIYLVVLIVRQIIEPKIIGHQLGVHPLLTLGGMYVGARVIGIPGFILGPITVVVLKSLLATFFRNKPVNSAAEVKSKSLKRPNPNTAKSDNSANPKSPDPKSPDPKNPSSKNPSSKNLNSKI
ncbi:MAG: sporulation integral membrane protein YtvI [Eubacteriales bacterium]|nr:sporulation integral membrane protein YtvI [Eubacteriales bacterium]